MYLLAPDTIEAHRRTAQLLGLQNDEETHSQYSHGMKNLCLQLRCCEPDLLFLDEPFEGVDAVTSRVIRDMLAGYVDRGSTVFLTSHVLDVVEKLCTHVGIIASGKLVEQASLDDIRQGSSLEQRFLERVGADSEVTQKLSWLEEAAP
jgi:ABC-2 type transport system ATP-binding protein